MFRRIDARTLVAGQLAPGDVASLAAQGVTMLVNNRPDGEEPGQPAEAAIAAAARAAGIDYRFIPVAGAGLVGGEAEAMAAALAEARGQTLAFCRSGTRSAYLVALARERQREG